MRVAVIGCGLIGRRRATIVRGSAADTLVVVADAVPERASELGRELECNVTTDWRDAVARDEVDAVVVATTHDWLAPVAMEAVRRGKHVLIEKPMARSPEEARALLRAAAVHPDGRVVIKAGFNHRHHGAVWTAHAALRRGDIGEPYLVRCRYGHGGRPGYAEEWRSNRAIAGGGELLDQGIHAIDLFRWFVGDFVEGVGFATNFYWRPPAAKGVTPDPVEDNVFGLFRTARGQVASLHASWTQWRNVFSFEVFGRDGYLIVDGLGGSYGPERLIAGRRRPESGPPDEHYLDFPADISWEGEWAEFTAAVRDHRAPLGSGYDAWQALKMAGAIYESERTGTVVQIAADEA